MDLSVRPGSRIATLPAPLRPPAVAVRAGFGAYRRWRNRPRRPPYVFQDDGLATAHLSPAQIDPAFAARYAGIRQRCWPDVPWDISWRLWLLARLARTAAPLAGSFAEFGSFRGGCAYMVLSSLDLRPDQKLYLFDTFEGIPGDALTPAERASRFADRYQDTSPEMVRELLQPWSDAVELVVGDVRQTVLEVETGPLALAQLDMNAAAPTLPALEYVWDRLVPHGLVVFDDYGYGVTEYQDQRVLIESFFTTHPGQVVELPTGQAFATKPP